MSYVIGKEIGKGKNKTLYEIEGKPNLVKVVFNDDITKFDNKKLTKTFEGKGELCNRINISLCTLLNRQGIPTAFVEKDSANGFIAKKCKMLPLEIVFVKEVLECSSFIKRNPGIAVGTVFNFPILQLFAKTTEGVLKDWTGEKVLFDNLPVDDPFIANLGIGDGTFGLFHPKKPYNEKDSYLGYKISIADLMGPDLEIRKGIYNIFQEAFIFLINFFAKYGYTACDIKFEAGICDGKLFIADSVELDGMRVVKKVNGDIEDYSKELFRQGVSLELIKERYTIIADLLESAVR